MKNSKVKEIVVPAVSLFLICAAVTALLALTNQVTAPKISQLAVETENRTKNEVLADAKSFSDAKSASLEGSKYTYYEGLDGSGKIIGYVFSTSAKGYGGDIDVMVGIDSNGVIKGVSILSISETAGLGMNAKNDSFLNQYNGKSGELSVIKNGTPAEDEIQALTGATITSKAMTNAVNIAQNLYTQVGGENDG